MKRYTEKEKARAIRKTREYEQGGATRWGATKRAAEDIGCAHTTVQLWVKKIDREFWAAMFRAIGEVERSATSSRPDEAFRKAHDHYDEAHRIFYGVSEDKAVSGNACLAR